MTRYYSSVIGLSTHNNNYYYSSGDLGWAR